MANLELARAEAALAEIAEHSHGILSGRAAQVLLDEMRRLRAVAKRLMVARSAHAPTGEKEKR